MELLSSLLIDVDTDVAVAFYVFVAVGGVTAEMKGGGSLPTA